MGQDKKQLTKLLAFVKELYDHPDNRRTTLVVLESVYIDR